MSKKFLNKKQKRILYKNTGILLGLTVLCAILARSGIFTGGETLEDLAQKQKQEAVSPTEAETASPAKTGTDSPVKTTADSQDGQSPQPENESTPQEEELPMDDRVLYQEGFYYESLNDTIREKITGVSYPADDTDAAISYDTLRHVSLLYYDFNGDIQRGELICHKAIAQDLVEIFYELYEMRYPIEKIALIEDYQGDDELSMQDNNTSCFNYRALASGKLSNHAYGLAVDLNPFYNPYVTHRSDGSVHIAPSGSEEYADREQAFAHKIDEEDPACLLFKQHGFTWGGNWRSVKDYQHFEKEL